MSDVRNHLDERIRAFYEGQRLAPDVLEQLPPLAAAGRRAARPWLRAAAAVLVVSTMTVMLLWRGPRDDASLAPEIASEIALNHTKQLRPDLLVTSFAELPHAMPALDFSPIHPQRVRDAGYRLVGARYCSVRDAVAVQIRLRDDADRPYTLYEFRGDDSFASLGEHEIETDGVHVHLWREAGLIIGLARSRD